MFLFAPLDSPPVSHRMTAGATGAIDGTWVAARPRFDSRDDVSRRHILGKLAIGRTEYPLRVSLEGYFYPRVPQEKGEFWVGALGPEFIGHGVNSDEAYFDWTDQVHCRFQELYAKQDFEMTTPEKLTWQILESVIDVADYRRTTPLSFREFGKVIEARPTPRRVEWEDGRKERVRLDQMPHEFAAYKSGQPFEAIVLRDPINLRIREVAYVRRTRPLPPVSREEFDAALRSIPSVNSLPDADWN